MEDPRERMTASVSVGELERRWKLTREIMREKGVDFLIMRQDEEYLGGYVRWFTDIPANHSYPFTVIFPLDDEMTLIGVGGFPPQESYYPPKWAVHGVKRRLCAPYFPSFHFTSTMDAELVLGVLREKKQATIGWVGLSYITVPFYEYIVKNLPGYRFVDMTDLIDNIKVIKSSEEIEFIKRTAALQDAAMEYLKETIRPGMRDFEVLAECQYFCVKQGSERQLILVGSSPQDTPTRWQFRRFQNRMIKEGDKVSVLIEVNGPGGFYTELGRVFSIGKPSQLLQDAFGIAVEAQELVQKLMKPGVDPKDLLEANNEFLQKKGYYPERRLFAHGQGYDLVERPAIRNDETMKIKANMNITIHPFAIRENVWAPVTDNFLVTETGESVRIHKFPKEIIII
jgi:Xaa-Pro aminopeptidase